MVYNVDINANQKVIKNVKLDKSVGNSVATVVMVKELIPFTTDNIYRQYFEEIYDFSDASMYGLSRGSLGVIINSLRPNITLLNKDLRNIKKEGLNVNGYDVTFSPSFSSKYTLCIVFYHWRNRSFSLTKRNVSNNVISTNLNYDETNNSLNLSINRATRSYSMPSSFNGKKIVLWLTENFYTNVSKASISNYSSKLTISAAQYSIRQFWKFTTEDGELDKLIFSPKFYDFDSEQFHKVMLQEKLNGSYIV